MHNKMECEVHSKEIRALSGGLAGYIEQELMFMNEQIDENIAKGLLYLKLMQKIFSSFTNSKSMVDLMVLMWIVDEQFSNLHANEVEVIISVIPDRQRETLSCCVEKIQALLLEETLVQLLLFYEKQIVAKIDQEFCEAFEVISYTKGLKLLNKIDSEMQTNSYSCLVVYSNNRLINESEIINESNEGETARLNTISSIQTSNVRFQFYKNMMKSLLTSHKTNKEVKGNLLNLLGHDTEYFVDQLVDLREIFNGSELFLEHEVTTQLVVYAYFNLIDVKSNYINDLEAALEKKMPCTMALSKSNVMRAKPPPALSKQIIIQSEEEKQLAKQIRKIKVKTTVAKEDKTRLCEELEELKHQPLFNRKIEQSPTYSVMDLPNVYDERRLKFSQTYVEGKVMALPENAERKTNKKYEEIKIPAQVLKKDVEICQRVSIQSLDSVGQLVFKDIEFFNTVQSTVFDVAYNSNENMLICAPTGAGKTNIALMTIVHLFREFTEASLANLKDFKVIYICPMKALAAEMRRNFSKRLEPLGLVVKELTGDIQMTRAEMMEANMLITTPEKWDIVTRKGNLDRQIPELVKLIIFDEIHLLNNDRGPVIEALVSRTLRQIVTTQKIIRMIGLSATIPNYVDVALFLKVNLQIGLFYFDSRFRSVPLDQTFIGIKDTSNQNFYNNQLDEICFEKVVSYLKNSKQVMVFVHTRNSTVKTALALKNIAVNKGQSQYFVVEQNIQQKKSTWKLQNHSFDEMLSMGIGVHHAGMARSDRTEMEKLFLNGSIKVLVSTATLAWGVNLPAHAVIIKGTSLYDAKKSSQVELDILDVLQIFGRAGRPQFDTFGSAVLITKITNIPHYLSALTNQVPIESKFLNALTDNLNAEIALGTVNNMQDAVQWLSFTYLFIRMKMNPLVYGFTYDDLYEDETLATQRFKYINEAAKLLNKAHMIRFEVESGEFYSTNLGRAASTFYISFDTVETFDEMINPHMTEADVISMMCRATEFANIQVRQEEFEELDMALEDFCLLPVPGGSENAYGKVNILLQSHISRGYFRSMSLVSDREYIIQNATRIARALFEISLYKNMSTLAENSLSVAQMLEHRMWTCESPLKQFGGDIPNYVFEHSVSVEDLRGMDEGQISGFIRNRKLASMVKRYAEILPLVDLETTIQPITRNVLRVKLHVKAMFKWSASHHFKTGESFWIWIESADKDCIYHSEMCIITKSLCITGEPVELIFTIPIAHPPPLQYIVKAISSNWLGTTRVFPLDFRNLVLPDNLTPHTDLLNLQPLTITALHNSQYESLFKFTHFNPVQTQAFHCLYHTNKNILLGASTGCGKTIAAEICIFRLFNTSPNQKVVYIAPLKALARERMIDWQKKFGEKLNKNVVQVTGDISPSMSLNEANIIITTPEKWDGLSRDWKYRKYIQNVGLIVIDEIHLLGAERGPVLEVIVSRVNFIRASTNKHTRIIGLSTALANAGDLAEWLEVDNMGLYNFRPSVRPVTLDIHIKGFPGKHYCPRMLSMNKSVYQAIQQHAPNSPVLVFCSSRKQTRLTGEALITYLLTQSSQQSPWLHENSEQYNEILSMIKDEDLKYLLSFGIGIHHAGLQESDRGIVESLFVKEIIQVLICTSTLAWGVNFPARLVIIKGTEFYDANTKTYKDMPVTDILQMIGRAGRPQYNDSGVACVFVHDIKKNFYGKFLYEPFPVESNLLEVLPDHINAEISIGSIKTKQQFLNYLTWTYFYIRLLHNPAYYNLDDTSPDQIGFYLSNLTDSVIDELVKSECVEVDQKLDVVNYSPTILGSIACDYYLSHKTVFYLKYNIKPNASIISLLENLSMANEYVTFPVRHNEDLINAELLAEFHYKTKLQSNSPHLKVLLLLYGYFNSAEMPNQEYVVDTKSVLDQAIRIAQSMQEIVTANRWLSCAIKMVHLKQMIVQGLWLHNCDLLTLPFITNDNISALLKKLARSRLTVKYKNIDLQTLLSLDGDDYNLVFKCFMNMFGEEKTKTLKKALLKIPNISLHFILKNCHSNGMTNLEILNRCVKLEGLIQDGKYLLILKIHRQSMLNLEVHTKRFPKQKEEAWFVLMGCVENDILIYSKNVTAKAKYVFASFIIPTDKKGIFHYELYFMSDCYIGLDQQYTIQVAVQ